MQSGPPSRGQFAALTRRAWLRGLLASRVAGAAAASPADEAAAVVLSVPGPGSSIALPFELAYRLGLDREAGLALRLRFVGGGGVALRDLQTRTADFAALGLPAVLHARRAGADVVALAAIDDLPLYALVVRSGLRGRVRTPADLRGLTLGMHTNSLSSKTTSHQLLELVLRRHGVAPAEVRLVPAGQSWETQQAALRSGTIDASMTEESIARRLQSSGTAFTLFATGRREDADGVPGAGFLRGVLVATRDTATMDPERTRRVVGMSVAALRWIAANDAAALSEALGLPVGEQRDALLAVRASHPRQFSRDGRFSRQQLAQTRTFFEALHPESAGGAARHVEHAVLDTWVGTKP